MQCGTLSQHDILGPKVTFPNTTLYEDRLASYYSASAALPPWCMILPLSTEDVSLIAQIISELECPFGMRSGGHASFTGANSVREVSPLTSVGIISKLCSVPMIELTSTPQGI